MTVPQIWEPHHGLEHLNHWPYQIIREEEKKKKDLLISTQISLTQISITNSMSNHHSFLSELKISQSSTEIRIFILLYVQSLNLYFDLCNKKSGRVVDTCGSKGTWRGSWWTQHPTRDCYPGPRGMIIMHPCTFPVSLSLFTFGKEMCVFHSKKEQSQMLNPAPLRALPWPLV